MPHTMILGASGFLGRYIAREYKDNAKLHSSSAKMDSRFDCISKFESENDVSRLFKENDFDTLINCVALANLEKCESSPDIAIWLNKTLPGLLAKYCTKNEKKLIHISTDAVFNTGKIYAREEDRKEPQSWYARTKLEGENLVTQEAKVFNIFRVNFYGKSPNQKGLLEFFYQNLKENNQIVGFKDVFFTPLYAEDTARIIKSISKSRNTGIFHLVGTERLSKYEFGKKVAIIMKKNEKLIASVDFSESPLALNRTRELSLDTSKIRNLGYIIPPLESGIKRAIAELEND